MVVGELEVDIIQKDIKNLHLAVYPPLGRVRLAAPLDVNQQTLELYIISKIPWIRKQQRKFAKQNRQSPRQYIDRESHYFFGKRYLLRVHESDHPYRFPKVLVSNKTYIELYIKPNYSTEQKADLMREWYRAELKMMLDELIPKWEKLLNVQTNDVKVKSMRTKWGSCNTEKGNILINLELAKKPLECIEYIVAHELVHLIERKHSDVFKAHLDLHVPNWKSVRDELNSLPVGALTLNE